MNLGSRVLNALPYVVIALGFLFYISFLEPSISLNSVNAGHPYVVGGVFALLYTKKKIEKTSYVLVVPAMTFLALTGTWLYFESPSPELSTGSVFVFGAVSFLFVLGHTAKKREWAYVVGSVIAYFACVLVVASSSLRLDLPMLNLQGPFSFVLPFLYIIGPGAPLTVIIYSLLKDEPKTKEWAYVTALVLAYVVWIVFFAGSRTQVVQVALGLGPLATVLVLVLSLGTPRAVVPHVLSDGDSKMKEWTYVSASVFAYAVWVCVFIFVVLLLSSSFAGGIIYEFTLRMGTPLALVAYVVSSRNQSGRN